MQYLLQHLLTNAAKINPQKDAVLFNDESITYGELDNITNKLATVLLRNGVNQGDRIGIYMSKSISSIISIHGILKAGGVYVPLDPKAPPARLAYIIKDCGIKCLLTSTYKVGNINKMFLNANPLKLIILTDNLKSSGIIIHTKVVPWSNVINTDELHDFKNNVIENDLAYILYTSGSTGTPKGVMISHLNAFTFLNWVKEMFQINQYDRLSNHAPLHFDLSILDLFGTFYSGATLVLVPDFISTFPIKLSEWIERNRISIWYSVPSILTMMLLHGDIEKHRFSDLRTVIFAGEVFPIKYLRKLIHKIPNAKFFNLYGPTETNVITYYEVEEIPSNQTKPIPIGKSCTNMRVFAIKENGQILNRPGEEGELYAAGSCVANGYWGDEEKTKQRFVWNPIQLDFRERAYKTGDIVTLDEYGNFIYKDRCDHMIKSRGYRIELGEIETVLYSHPEIQEAAVVAIPDELIGHRIKAFVVLKQGEEMSLIKLKTFCGRKLPKYMIPENFDFLQALPKTSTGKVNKPKLLNNEI